jgi:hypothetical protein
MVKHETTQTRWVQFIPITEIQRHQFQVITGRRDQAGSETGWRDSSARTKRDRTDQRRTRDRTSGRRDISAPLLRAAWSNSLHGRDNVTSPTRASSLGSVRVAGCPMLRRATVLVLAPIHRGLAKQRAPQTRRESNDPAWEVGELDVLAVCSCKIRRALCGDARGDSDREARRHLHLTR